MGEFKRARSAEQKCQRMDCIKHVAAAQFAARPYHEITLTTIADELGWSRANLYKYVSTKEEIFLDLMGDARAAYTEALLAAFPAGCGYSLETAAEVWAGIANAHHDFFRYGDLLYTVIETNVSLERLVEFKRCYYAGLSRLQDRLSANFGIPREAVEGLCNTIYYHAMGLLGSCLNNPLVRDAVAQLGIEVAPVDFLPEMREFILMCLERYARERS